MGSTDVSGLLILGSFCLSLGICLLLTPLIRRLSIRSGWVAQLRQDRWGSRSVPILGGVGIFIAFWGSVIVSIMPNGGITVKICIFLICAAVMFLLGMVDDAKKVKPQVKLLWQLVAATVVIFLGETWIEFFPWPVANILLTYLWIIGITNAINLLDNMDGLAGGIAIIASGILGYFFWIDGQYFLLQISLALSGALLGFLIFNFPPAKIFMGNSGSMFLGFFLAELAIARQAQASNVLAALGVPTLIMLLPILDTSFVTITRLLRGQSPIQGGTDHTSHRLIAFGLSERYTILILYGIALLSGIAAAGLEALDYDLSLVFIPSLLIALVLFAAHLGKVRIVAIQNPTRTSTNGPITFTNRRILFEILLDLMIIGFSYYLAYWTRFGLNMTAMSMDLFLQSWPIALGLTYFLLFLFRVYRSIWEYLCVKDLLRYGGAAICAGCATWVVLMLIYPASAFPGDVFILYFLFLFLGLAGSRASFKILDQFYSEQKTRHAKIGILIYGADDDGETILNWLIRHSEYGFKPIGFIDEEPQNWGMQIHGVKVIGDISRSLPFLEQGEIQGIIISSRALLYTTLGSQLLEKCRERNIWIRLLRLELEDV